mgnify:CR=1 FL=1
MVLSGRFPYLSYPRRYGAQDIEVARRAMEQMRILQYSDYPMSQLSGGMRQKVYIAMALAQQAGDRGALLHLTKELIIILLPRFRRNRLYCDTVKFLRYLRADSLLCTAAKNNFSRRKRGNLIGACFGKMRKLACHQGRK